MTTIRPDEQAIFEVARNIDSREAREAYIQQICGDDAAIGRRVRALLKAYEERASFLESPRRGAGWCHRCTRSCRSCRHGDWPVQAAPANR